MTVIQGIAEKNRPFNWELEKTLLAAGVTVGRVGSGCSRSVLFQLPPPAQTPVLEQAVNLDGLICDLISLIKGRVKLKCLASHFRSATY